MESGELTSRMLGEYKTMGELCFKYLGRDTLVEKLTPTDFARLRDARVNKGVSGEGWGPHHVTNGITRIRTIFKYGFDLGLMTGPSASGPSSGRLPRRCCAGTRQRLG